MYAMQSCIALSGTSASGMRAPCSPSALTLLESVSLCLSVSLPLCLSASLPQSLTASLPTFSHDQEFRVQKCRDFTLSGGSSSKTIQESARLPDLLDVYSVNWAHAAPASDSETNQELAAPSKTTDASHPRHFTAHSATQHSQFLCNDLSLVRPGLGQVRICAGVDWFRFKIGMHQEQFWEYHILVEALIARSLMEVPSSPLAFASWSWASRTPARARRRCTATSRPCDLSPGRLAASARLQTSLATDARRSEVPSLVASACENEPRRASVRRKGIHTRRGAHRACC